MNDLIIRIIFAILTILSLIWLMCSPFERLNNKYKCFKK